MDRAATADTSQLIAALGYINAWLSEQNPTDSTLWFANTINDAVDALEAAQSAQNVPQDTSTAQCGKSDSHARSAPSCDRPAHHTGDCSWMAGRRLRMLAEYHDAASEAQRLGIDNDRLTRENRKLRKDLAYLEHHTRPWWKRIFG